MSANTKPILPCEQPEVVEISLIRSREAGLSNDFVPVVELDKTYPEKGFKYVNSSNKCLLSAYIESNQIPLECVQFDGEKDIILRFVVKQGNKAAQDKKGDIHAVGHGVTIISEAELNVKYGYKILLKLSPENITPGAYIDFYANDDDLFYYSVQNVHCGRVQISGIANNCYCIIQGVTKSSCNGNGCIIDDETYKIVAKRLGVEVAVLKAISKKESKGSGFYTKGQARILFERHYMYRELKKTGKTDAELKQLQSSYSDIINIVQGGYGKESAQYEKLKKAKNIDIDCAIKSCSWGRFQVMGVYYENLYDSPQHMEEAMNMCERQHFEYFSSYLKETNGLIKALNEHNWEKVAELYNGKKWREINPDYAKDLKTYYDSFK